MRELILTKGLQKSFSTPAGELRILKGIDTVFYEGEMVSIVGASGVGKSTFLHLLGTLDRPTSGQILYRVHDGEEGINPFSLGNGELALFRNRVIGFVFQFHYLLPEFSALENVMMPGLLSGARGASGGDRQELKVRAEELLSELGVYERRGHKPGELSGGEQQRVAVARALIRNPKAVLADEPTGNLDAETGEGLFRLLMDINRKRHVTFIIVTHNTSLSSRCQRVLQLVDGKLRDS